LFRYNILLQRKCLKQTFKALQKNNEYLTAGKKKKKKEADFQSWKTNIHSTKILFCILSDM